MISVIVPVYNADKYIEKCIRSILSQDVDLELILIDDGSTDDSLNICSILSYSEPRIRIIYQDHSGQSVARNKGIEVAEGEYITFVDADDYLPRNALKNLLKNINDSDLVIGDYRKIGNFNADKRTGIHSETMLLNEKEIVEYTLKYLYEPKKYLMFAFLWGRLFKTSIIRSHNLHFDEKLRTFEDITFNFEYLKYVKDVTYLDTVVYNYFINPTSLSSKIVGNPDRLFGFNSSLKEIGNYLEGKADSQVIKEKIGNNYINTTIVQLVRICGQSKDGLVYEFIQKLVNDPTLRDNLKYYHSKGSKMIPLLIRLRWVRPLIWLCRYKALRRYR